MEFDKIEKFVRQNKHRARRHRPGGSAGGGAGRSAASPRASRCSARAKEAAQLEADKWFAKELMRQQAIPTAEARSFTDPDAAEEYVRMRDEPLRRSRRRGWPRARASRVCYRTGDALEAIDADHAQARPSATPARASSSKRCSPGPECSILAFVDRKNIYVMETAPGPQAGRRRRHRPDDRRHGRVFADAGDHRRDARDRSSATMLVPVVDGLVREGIDYKGVLYAGLMLTTNGPEGAGVQLPLRRSRNPAADDAAARATCSR